MKFRFTDKVCLVALAMLLLVLSDGRAIAEYGYVKWSLRNAPWAWIVPKPLPTAPEIASAKQSLSYFGYKFDVPWNEIRYEKRYKSVVVLNFSDGVGLIFFDPEQTVNELEAMKEAAGKQGRDITSEFGTEITRSSYDVRKASLSITPNDLRLFSSRREIAANSIMLLIKSVEIKRFKGGVFSFETKWLRGFQEGGPSRDDGIVVDAYDEDDRKVELLLGTKRVTAGLTQPEINCILYSLHPISASETETK
jgi:hypothetical protein